MEKIEMKVFGDKKEFAIALDFYTDCYKDDEYLQENIKDFFFGAEVYFWVKGENLFAFEKSAPDKTYGYYNLLALVDFLTDYLVFHITETAFPIETKATNAIDMIEETALVKSDVEDELQACAEIDWDNIDMEEREKVDEWIDYRSFSINNGGTFLPNIMVRKVKDKIEISWYNRHQHDDGEHKFYMLHKKGVEYIGVKSYKDVVIQFCLAYIEHIQEKEPELAARYRKNLQKAIDVEL